mmetsp:Transcript_6478/g.14042  ORF Transcript_6478/g.14042 Transcript_6478/m.14042 type:complete len:319 (+) Transcript_6478:656-1612(+)
MRSQSEGQVVGHAHQLTEVDALGLVLAQFSGALRGELNGAAVVRGHQDLTLCVLADLRSNSADVVAENGIDGVVEVRLGVLVGLADGGLDTLLLGLLPFGHHVGTSHNLGTKVPALLLRSREVVDDHVVHALEVGLVGLEDDGCVAAVVLALQEQDQVVNGGLDGSPLSVDHDSHTLFLGKVHDSLHPAAQVEVELGLLFVERRSVQWTRVNATSGHLVDVRKSNALRPLQVVDRAVTILVNILEDGLQGRLVLDREKARPVVLEGVPINAETSIHGVERHSRDVVVRGWVLADFVEELGHLLKAGGHALQELGVSEA